MGTTMGELQFYLGTHMPDWLTRVPHRLFVSHRRLQDRRTLPRAIAPWSLDSGAFSEVALHGSFLTTPTEYVTAVRRYRDEIGRLDWAAPQDHMCEPIRPEEVPYRQHRRARPAVDRRQLPHPARARRDPAAHPRAARPDTRRLPPPRRHVPARRHRPHPPTTRRARLRLPTTSHRRHRQPHRPPLRRRTQRCTGSASSPTGCAATGGA